MTRAAVFAANLGLGGMEFAHGIPGTVGGGVYMNAGAYGGEICQMCESVTVMDPEGNLSMDEEWNVNGSYLAIEGITSMDGRCFGKMAHSERRDCGVAINIYGEQDLKIFESGVKYFRD